VDLGQLDIPTSTCRRIGKATDRNTVLYCHSNRSGNATDKASVCFIAAAEMEFDDYPFCDAKTDGASTLFISELAHYALAIP
jgi:hypothetical protein